MSSSRPSFTGACAQAGSENAATNEANSKFVGRIMGLPGLPSQVLQGIFYSPQGASLAQ
jgi:hypothetical protein